MLVSGSCRGTRMPELTSRLSTFCGLLMFLTSLMTSSRALSAPNPEVSSRPSPTQTTLLSFIPAWLAVSCTGPEEDLEWTL